MDTGANVKPRDFSAYADTVRISKDGMSISWDTSRKGHYAQQNRARKPKQKWNTLPASGNDKNDVWIDEFTSRHITPLEAERLQTLPDLYTDCIKSQVTRCELCGNGWTVDVICHLLGYLKGVY